MYSKYIIDIVEIKLWQTLMTYFTFQRSEDSNSTLGSPTASDGSNSSFVSARQVSLKSRSVSRLAYR